MNDPKPYESPQIASTPAELGPPAETVIAKEAELAWDAKSFWGMVSTQFLGAFNDNLFKQLVLLLAVPTAAAAGANAGGKSDIQGLALAIFSAPFLLFSGFAGYLSERYSKQRVIFLCKVAEIGIMLLGMVGFLLYDNVGMVGLLVVLCLMGTHSAFFGPGKYGVLPELFSTKHLAMVNGVVLMTTFLAIIFGMGLAGVLKDWLGDDNLWIASLVCVGVAVIGTQTAHLVRKTPPVDSNLPFTWSALVVPEDVRKLLRNDGPLVRALLASCMFWLVGGVVLPTANAVGKSQFNVSETATSILGACMGTGIMFGSMLAAWFSKQAVNWRLVKIGGWGITACLLLLALPGSKPYNLVGLVGSHVLLLLLGLFAGLFAVPISVFLQSRPPKECKGRVIATMNLANWIAIVASAGIYEIFHRIIIAAEWPHYYKFAFTALLILPVAIFYRPSNKE